ncbi:MAG: GNAT family N-acetyltransferase [Alphaproteobacteria bacterium]
MNFKLRPFTLRQAVPDDSEAVAALHVACWRETYRGLLPDALIDGMNVADRTVQWQRALERRADVQVILAEDDSGALAGFASGGPARDAALGAAQEIYAIYVRRAAQRHGVGRILLRAVAANLAARTLDPARLSLGLWVLSGNAPARAFYERMGGAPADERVERRDGHDLAETAYRWSDLRALMGASSLDGPPPGFA